MIDFIRGFYGEGRSIGSVSVIETEPLIKSLWEIGDEQTIIRHKRKNLSSIKSSINADLKKLYHEGKNPEGIIIGPDNTFIMSDEAKDKILQKLNGSIGHGEKTTLDQMADLLKMIQNNLAKPAELMDENGAGRLRENQGTDTGTV
ncbi:MAG: hypothetical protein ABII06_06890 [Pseudomonadota bacterium]